MMKSSGKNFISLGTYCLFLTLLYVIVIGVYLSRDLMILSQHRGLFTLVLPLLEVLAFYLFAKLLLCIPGKIIRILLFLFASVFASLFVIQCLVLYKTSAYTSQLALENLDSAQFQPAYIALIVMLVLNLTLIALAIKNTKRIVFSSKSFLLGYLIVSVLVAGIYTSYARRQEFAYGAQIARYQTPVLGAFILLFQHKKTLVLEQEALEQLAKYPFVRDVVYDAPLPYQHKEGASHNKNVIVFFAEGVSSRLLQTYEDRFPGISPNINRFAQKSLVVHDYYNHTAATFRGLRGQLISGYQQHDGENAEGTGWADGANVEDYSQIRNQSLVNILNKNGYDTYFASPHTEELALNKVLRSFNFKEVLTLERMCERYLQDIQPLRKDVLADRDLLLSLTHFLEERKDKDEKPFFVGVYNFGTHVFENTPEKHTIYPEKNNPVLNRVHNFDHYFGDFLDFFFESGLHKNTVLIVTADHATYFEPDYVKVAGSDYFKVFVDRIPLIIYDESIDFPAHYDAKGRNSLCFTPTLLHILGVKNEKNAFLGHSIFEESSTEMHISTMDGIFFMSRGEELYHESGLPEADWEQYFEIKKDVELYLIGENHNLLFPTDEGG